MKGKQLVDALSTHLARDSLVRFATSLSLLLIGLFDLNKDQLSSLSGIQNDNDTANAVNLSFLYVYLIQFISIDKFPIIVANCRLLFSYCTIIKRLNRFVDNIPMIYELFKFKESLNNEKIKVIVIYYKKTFRHLNYIYYIVIRKSLLIKQKYI
jgi:hypothetical protein